MLIIIKVYVTVYEFRNKEGRKRLSRNEYAIYYYPCLLLFRCKFQTVNDISYINIFETIIIFKNLVLN